MSLFLVALVVISASMFAVRLAHRFVARRREVGR